MTHRSHHIIKLFLSILLTFFFQITIAMILPSYHHQTQPQPLQRIEEVVTALGNVANGSSSTPTPSTNSSTTVPSESTQKSTPEKNSSVLVVAIASSAAAALLIILLLSIYCCIRMRKSKQLSRQTLKTADLPTQADTHVPPTAEVNRYVMDDRRDSVPWGHPPEALAALVVEQEPRSGIRIPSLRSNP